MDGTLEFAALHFFEEFTETSGKTLWRIVGIQTAGLGQQPDPAMMYPKILHAGLCPGARKNLPECPNPKKGQIAWTPVPDPLYQIFKTPVQFLGPQFRRSARSPLHQHGDTETRFKQRDFFIWG